MEKDNSIKVIGAVLAGALAGAAIAILFAPDKGSITRARLKDGAASLADDIKSEIRKKAAALREQADALESALSNEKQAVQQKNKPHDEMLKNQNSDI
jgi:gas vesicle protein